MFPIRKIAVALALAGLLLACAGSAALAMGQWVNGTVTRSPWQDRYWRIEINRIRYTLMPDAATRQRVEDGKGHVYYQPVPVAKAAQGKKVDVRSEGFRIYEIIID